MSAELSEKRRITRTLEAIEAAEGDEAEAALRGLQAFLRRERLEWAELLSPLLPEGPRARLVKILGMTGSHSLGEARAAIARARAVAAKAGIPWAKVFPEPNRAEFIQDAEFREAKPPPRPKPTPPKPTPPKPTPPTPKPAPAQDKSPEAGAGPGFWTVQQCDSGFEGIWYTAIVTGDADRAARIFRDRCGTVRPGGGVRLRGPNGKVAREFRPPR